MVYDETDAGPAVVLGSALVPFWDERFSGGLHTALFLELPPPPGVGKGERYGHAARPAELPCAVRAAFA